MTGTLVQSNNLTYPNKTAIYQLKAADQGLYIRTKVIATVFCCASTPAWSNAIGQIISAKCNGTNASSTQQCLPENVERVGGVQSQNVTGNGSGTEPFYPIAVMDSGISSNPDLNIVTRSHCASRFGSQEGDAFPAPGHGTLVAGLIAAKDDNKGIVGAAPGSGLVEMKVADSSGTVYPDAVIDCLNYAIGTHGGSTTDDIWLINMSFAGKNNPGSACPTADPYQQAFCDAYSANINVVAAAGNNCQNDPAPCDITTNNVAPAAFDQVLAVTSFYDSNSVANGVSSATACSDSIDETCSAYTNYTSTTSPDGSHMIAAPGGSPSASSTSCIVSTSSTGGYSSCLAGTSVAAPIVTGALAAGWGICCASGSPSANYTNMRVDAYNQGASWGFKGSTWALLGTLYFGPNPVALKLY